MPLYASKLLRWQHVCFVQFTTLKKSRSASSHPLCYHSIPSYSHLLLGLLSTSDTCLDSFIYHCDFKIAIEHSTISSLFCRIILSKSFPQNYMTVLKYRSYRRGNINKLNLSCTWFLNNEDFFPREDFIDVHHHQTTVLLFSTHPSPDPDLAWFPNLALCLRLKLECHFF